MSNQRKQLPVSNAKELTPDTSNKEYERKELIHNLAFLVVRQHRFNQYEKKSKKKEKTPRS